ncbi:MAG: hypothetical protein KAH95_09965 [Spirochaetales bacterium]|nr:hypothetical protein [Spirochaetales bacterium]
MRSKYVLGFIFSTLLILLSSSFIFPMGYKENEINGNNLYKDGDFEGASVEYSEGLGKKADFDLYYNRGVSYYKLGQYDKSFSDFEDAGTYANSEKDQIKAVYNAGNSNYMLAETVKAENPEQALEHYGKAVNHFERVLQLDYDNPDASYNLELSRIKLDELKQQQDEEQEEGDQESEDQQDGEQQDGNEQEGDQQEQNSEQQDGEQQNADQQQEEQQQSENTESAYSSEEISPKDILNEEARRQEAMQLLISNGSGEPVDKDW